MTVGGIGRALEEPDTLSDGRTPGTGKSDFAAALLSIDGASELVEFSWEALLFAALGKTAPVSCWRDPSGRGCVGSPDATRWREPPWGAIGRDADSSWSRLPVGGSRTPDLSSFSLPNPTTVRANMAKGGAQRTGAIALP